MIAQVAEWFERGMSLGRQRRWVDAGEAFCRVLRLEPVNPHAPQAMLECARWLQDQGQPSPSSATTEPGAPPRLMSVVVCSIHPERFARLRANLEQTLAGFQWELILIDDAASLCDGYNRGIARTRGDLLILCHDDILFLDRDFPRKLAQYAVRYQLLGVAGTTRLSGPKWGWSGAPHAFSWVTHPAPNGQPGFVAALIGNGGPVITRAQGLDGVLLAGPRELFRQLSFDESTFDGFHFYDLDLSYRAHLAGVDTAICLDLLVFHQSSGRFDRRWSRYAKRFCAKFPELNPIERETAMRGASVPVAALTEVAPTFRWVSHWLNVTAP